MKMDLKYLHSQVIKPEAENTVKMAEWREELHLNAVSEDSRSCVR